MSAMVRLSGTAGRRLCRQVSQQLVGATFTPCLRQRYSDAARRLSRGGRFSRSSCIWLSLVGAELREISREF